MGSCLCIWRKASNKSQSTKSVDSDDDARASSSPKIEEVTLGNVEFVPPIQAAWNAVKDGQLSRRQACEDVITSKNCSASIEEWYYAHSLLIESVYKGVVPAQRSFKGYRLYWLQNLYAHAATLAIGKKDLPFMLEFFEQAETAGVIARGGQDDIFYRVQARNDIKNNECLLMSVVCKLFVRQAELDERLRKVLYYQDTQKLLSLVTAILACVPVVGKFSAAAIHGSASIIEGVDVSGLVETLLGLGKDFSGFVAEPLIDRFLRTGNEVLAEEAWRIIPRGLKNAVKDAAANLNLTVEELRLKFQIANAMPSVDENLIQTGLDSTVGSDLDVQMASLGGVSNGDRSKFVHSVINHVCSLGYNVVVVHPPSLSQGHEREFNLTLQHEGRDLNFKVYVARPHIKMQVTNCGDGGWINWGLKGQNWVRYGNTVKFHPTWDDETMGKRYETRHEDDLPEF